MRVTELKALARDRGLRNYSRMRKAELVSLLQNNPPPGQSPASAAPTPRTRPAHPNRHPPPAPQRRAAPAPQMSPSRTSRGALPENLQMIGDRGSLLNKKWIYSNDKK